MRESSLEVQSMTQMLLKIVGADTEGSDGAVVSGSNLVGGADLNASLNDHFVNVHETRFHDLVHLCILLLRTCGFDSRLRNVSLRGVSCHNP